VLFKLLFNFSPLNYFSHLKSGKLILWCYLIWYLVTLYNYFDPSPAIWLNSLGISVVIGFALLLSVGSSGLKSSDHWQTFRLFLMPFCVSSFSSLIKGHGFILIAPPSLYEFSISVGSCIAFVFFVFALKFFNRGTRLTPPSSGTPNGDL
jgi:hypothetical protein